MNIFSFVISNFSWIMKLIGEHLLIVLISLAISTTIGVILGIFVTRGKINFLKRFILIVIAMFQSVPSIGVIALIFVYTGIGKKTAIIALALYSIVPIFLNTSSSLFSIPASIKEVAKGMGMTNLEILLKVEIPLALRSIIAGIRTATTINIGTTTVATVIGAGGLGDIIFIGLRSLKFEMILTGALLVSALAVVSDLILSRFQNILLSKGLK